MSENWDDAELAVELRKDDDDDLDDDDLGDDGWDDDAEDDE